VYLACKTLLESLTTLATVDTVQQGDTSTQFQTNERSFENGFCEPISSICYEDKSWL